MNAQILSVTSVLKGFGSGCLLLLFFSIPAFADTHYVSLSGRNVWPYMNWTDAATIIQNAIETAADGDTVLVTNGVYDTGGRPANGDLTNRVAIAKPLIVCSVNGPEFTIIEGVMSPGDMTIRCVYLGTNATLIGFTLTNGHARASWGADSYGGGIFCEASAIVSNCALTGNSAIYGGGAYKGTLYNCKLSGNSAVEGGGGAINSTLHNCSLTGNRAYRGPGGGAVNSTLHNCVLTGNEAYDGGGVCGGTLYNCKLRGNGTENFGGGALGGTLYNCVLTSNGARMGGGGAFGGTLYNCALIGNSVMERDSNCNFGDEDGWQRVDRRRESVRDGGGSRKKDSFCSGLIFCVRV